MARKPLRRRYPVRVERSFIVRIICIKCSIYNLIYIFLNVKGLHKPTQRGKTGRAWVGLPRGDGLTPAPSMNPDLFARLLLLAVVAAAACGYLRCAMHGREALYFCNQCSIRRARGRRFLESQEGFPRGGAGGRSGGGGRAGGAGG